MMTSARTFLQLTAFSLLCLSIQLGRVEPFSIHSLKSRYSAVASTALQSGLDFLGYSANHHRHNDQNQHHNTSDRVPQITSIDSLDDYLDFLRGDNAEEHKKLTVIKFYASWCKSCAKFGAKYRQLALDEGDQVDTSGKLLATGRVRFAEVEFGANKRMCKSFGIKRLPYIHIYKGKAGKLEDFVCGPKKFNLLIDKVNEYVDMSDDEILLRRELEQGQALGDEIVQGLQGEQALDLGISASNTNSTQQVFRI